MRGTIQGEWRRKVADGGGTGGDEDERSHQNRNEKEVEKEESKGVEKKREIRGAETERN